MTKNQRKKYQAYRTQDSTGSDEKNDRIAALKNETTEKARGPGKLEDFPQLSISSGSHGSVTVPPRNSSKPPSNKSWLSIVSKGSLGNSREAFPFLPGSQDKQRQSNTSNEKDNGKSQFIVKNESTGSTTMKTEAQNPMSNREARAIPAKKTPVEPQRNPHKKKRSDPIFFNFQDLCMVPKSQKKTKKTKVFKSKFQRRGNKELLSGNYLDSSNPKRSRGKHREIKKKKLTKLKLAIVKERIIKQKIKEGAISDYLTGNECFQLIEKIDFKTEIKAYLDELNKKKKQKQPEGAKTQSTGDSKSGKCDEQAEEIKITKTIKKEEDLQNVVSESKEKKVPQSVKGGEIKFTSKFREYCDNILTPSLNSSASELIKELVKLQDRLFARDPIKAKTKRRHVSGIREAKKYLTLKKAKLIIIAPNLEKLQMDGGVYDSINELKSMAQEQEVPYGFALDRFGLGRCTRKNVPVSAFTVLNYEGAEALFQNTLHHLKEAKESFVGLLKPKTEEVEGSEKEDVNARVISSLMSAFREGMKISEENVESESL